MPNSQQPPRGNHFSGNNPKAPGYNTPGGANNPPRPSQGSGLPQNTEAFMMAARSSSHPHGAQAPQGVSYTQPSQEAGQTASPYSRDAARGQYQQAAGAPRQQTSANNGYGTEGNAHAAGNSPYGTSDKPKKGPGKVIGITLGAILLFILVFGAASGFMLYKDVKGVLAKVDTIMADATVLKDSLKSGDGAALKSSAQNISTQIGDINNTVHGPLWALATFIPVYGGDVQYARGLVEQADILAQDALLPACDSLANFSLDGLIKDGTIDLELLETVIGTLQDVTPTLSTCAAAINELPEPHIGKLKSVEEKLSGPLAGASEALAQINEVAPLLPQMLGSEGTRTYVVMAQQNAELRSTGGLPGSVGTMTVSNGKIEMGEFVAGTSIAQYPDPRFGVTAEEEAIFTNRMGRRITDTNFNPDFPRVCHFVTSMWEEEMDQTVDGVIAIDPVFLQYLLALTGGFDSEGINVNGDNAARLLLHDAYNDMPVEKTDAFFSGVASKVFDQIMGNLGNVGMTDLISTIKRSIDEHRLLIWMANDEEEAAMQKLGCDGALKTDETKPELGVYVSDETFSKISWYFAYNTVVSEGTKNADGTTTYHVTTTMENHLSMDEANKQVSYITGYNRRKRDLTDMYMHVYLVAPAGGTITNIKTEGDFSQQEITEMPYREFTFYTGSPRVKGGETVTITYDVTVSANATEPLTVRETPTAQVVAGWDKSEQSE